MTQLSIGKYSETELVHLLCTPKQIQAYDQKNKFSGGKYQQLFLQRLSKYCEYKYEPKNKKYNIIHLHDRGVVYDSRKQLHYHQGIYRYLCPLILNTLIENKRNENNKAIVTIPDLSYSFGLINSNYNKVRYQIHQVAQDFQIPYLILEEYMMKISHQMQYLIEKCLCYLHEEGCIQINNIYVVNYIEEIISRNETQISLCNNKTRRIATSEEIEMFNQIINETDNEIEIKKESERWYGKKSRSFQKRIRKKLKDHNIDYMCKGLEIWCVDMEKCNKLLDTYAIFSPDNYKFKVSELFKARIDSNTEKRNKKRKINDDEYQKYFNMLSSMTILQDAEDITPKLKSKISLQDQWAERSQIYSVEYSEQYRTEGEKFGI